MQDLLLELLDNSSVLSQRIYQLTRTMPGHQEAAQAADALEDKVRGHLGFELYDQYVSAFLRVLSYDVRAAYALGLGLRQELVKALRF